MFFFTFQTGFKKKSLVVAHHGSQWGGDVQLLSSLTPIKTSSCRCLDKLAVKKWWVWWTESLCNHLPSFLCVLKGLPSSDVFCGFFSRWIMWNKSSAFGKHSICCVRLSQNFMHARYLLWCGVLMRKVNRTNKNYTIIYSAKYLYWHQIYVSGLNKDSRDNMYTILFTYICKRALREYVATCKTFTSNTTQ